MTIDLIPWEQAPNEKLEPAEIKWNGGMFLVPRLGYMTPNELTKIREIDPDNEIYRMTLDATTTMHKAMEANEYHSLPLKHQLFLMLSTIHFEHKGVRSLGFETNPLREEIETNYREILDNYIASISELERRVMVRSATVMMQRIGPEWTDEATAEFPEAILLSLYSLQQQEEYTGRNEDPVEQRRAIEEDLKKLQAAVRSIVAARTGLKPTGNAADYGHMLQNLSEVALEASPPPTSPKPLKEATKTNGKGFTEKS